MDGVKQIRDSLSYIEHKLCDIDHIFSRKQDNSNIQQYIKDIQYEIKRMKNISSEIQYILSCDEPNIYYEYTA